MSSRLREAMRRLGVSFCQLCTSTDEASDMVVDTATYNQLAAIMKRDPLRASVGTVATVPLCTPCVHRYDQQRQGDFGQRLEQKRLARQFEWAQEDARAALLQTDAPSSSSYREAVHRHRGEIAAAQRSWRFGGGIFGGSDD